MANKNEIEQFLREFKHCIQIHVIDERQDGSNEATLAILGITPKQRLEEIKALNYKNYFRGPTPDHRNPSDNIWEFGKRVKGREIYIKLKVYTSTSGSKYGKCLSFHIADSPISYKFT